MTHPSDHFFEKEASVEWPAFVATLFERSAPYLSARGDTDHATISHEYALTLLQHEGGDRRIVEPAIILHDVGWSVLTPDEIAAAFGVEASGEDARRLNRVHEIEGAAIATGILEALDYPPALIEKISEIISRHDSGANAHSIEEKLIKDADKLWRFSRIGFWQETKRQHLKPDTLLQYIEVRCEKWFFSATAHRVARQELANRRRETNLEFGGRP